LEEPLRDEVPGRGMPANAVEGGVSGVGGAGADAGRAVQDVDEGGLGGIAIALGGGDGLLRVPDASGGDESDGDGDDEAGSDTRPLLSSK